MSKNKVPPIIIHHPHDGELRLGREDKDVLRKADCQLKAGSDAVLRLFRDGGWELRSKRGIEVDNPGSNIIQSGTGPLNIKVDGDFNIECGGEFNVNAAKIVMTANDAVDGNIKLNANQDFFAEAKKTAKLNGSNVQVIATQNLIARSDAAHVLQGGFVHVHENNSKIIPPSLKEFISKIQK